jgi:hypothetical protein
VATFEFLGGCAEILVPDNLRSGVTKAHGAAAGLLDI